MGTRLLAKGIQMGECLEVLNISNPPLVGEIHQEYQRAGAQLCKSNTFGANISHLARFHLEDKCREINRAGVQIAREIAGEAGFVAGAVGPIGNIAGRNARHLYALQMEALAAARADFILLETFRNLNDLQQALLAADDVCDLPVVAQISPDGNSNLEGGIGPDIFVPRMENWGADVIGCNCGADLTSLLETVRRMALLTGRPLCAQPSAGLPFISEGQTVYPCLPEEMAEATAQFIQMGVRMVGGCCGTTPDHIAAIRRAVDQGNANPAPTPAAQSGSGGAL